MQAVLANTIRIIKNNFQSKRLPKEAIPYLLKAAENADKKTRDDIENQLVNMGETVIEELAAALENTTGSTRALVAMVLIRFGNPSLQPLNSLYKGKREFEWIINYIQNEIEG